MFCVLGGNLLAQHVSLRALLCYAVILSCHNGGPRNKTQAIRLDSKCLHHTRFSQLSLLPFINNNNNNNSILTVFWALDQSLCQLLAG